MKALLILLVKLRGPYELSRRLLARTIVCVSIVRVLRHRSSVPNVLLFGVVCCLPPLKLLRLFMDSSSLLVSGLIYFPQFLCGRPGILVWISPRVYIRNLRVGILYGPPGAPIVNVYNLSQTSAAGYYLRIFAGIQHIRFRPFIVSSQKRMFQRH